MYMPGRSASAAIFLITATPADERLPWQEVLPQQLYGRSRRNFRIPHSLEDRETAQAVEQVDEAAVVHRHVVALHAILAFRHVGQVRQLLSHFGRDVFRNALPAHSPRRLAD